MKYITNSVRETKQIAKNIARKFKNKGGVIGLSGELGAGKTTFAQGFAKELGIKDKILSPTFTIIKQYQIPNSNKTFYHIDLYRLENPNVKELGIEELFQDKDAIVLIEWPERLSSAFNKKLLLINIDMNSINSREINIPD